jgi:hypothetical protein
MKMPAMAKAHLRSALLPLQVLVSSAAVQAGDAVLNTELTPSAAPDSTQTSGTVPAASRGIVTYGIVTEDESRQDGRVHVWEQVRFR